MAGLRGNPKRLNQIAANMRSLGTRLAQDVAAKAAPAITGMAGSSYDSGQTVFGDPRPRGVHGNELSLVESGRTRGYLRFVAIGTIVRVALGTRWAKFLVGKYRILPTAAAPFAWRKRIEEIAHTEIGKRVHA